MSGYTLTIQFSPEDVRDITRANQKVTIVKSVNGHSGEKVSMTSFYPFENNEIQWPKKFGVYASDSDVKIGTTIKMLASVYPALDARIYPFENQKFNDPEAGIDPNCYAIKNINKDGQQYTFGLSQSIIVNGSRLSNVPINAISVLANETAVFTPLEIISVFLEAKYNSGSIITYVDSASLEVDLTYVAEQTIHYDHDTGAFLPGPLAKT